MNPLRDRAILAGGSFWAMQDLIRKLPGIKATRAGYTDDDRESRAEALEILFDPRRITYRELLALFFRIEDPIAPSAIFYTSEMQQRIALSTIAGIEASGVWPGEIATEVAAATTFRPAEPERIDGAGEPRFP